MADTWQGRCQIFSPLLEILKTLNKSFCYDALIGDRQDAARRVINCAVVTIAAYTQQLRCVDRKKRRREGAYR